MSGSQQDSGTFGLGPSSSEGQIVLSLPDFFDFLDLDFGLLSSSSSPDLRLGLDLYLDLLETSSSSLSSSFFLDFESFLSDQS